MDALSLDLRRRIAEAVDGGMSQSQAARRFAVSRATVVRLLARRRACGTLEAKPRPGVAPRISPEQYQAVAAQMRAHRQADLKEHCRLWQQEHGTSLHASTLWRTLKRMNWSHKKRVCAPANKIKTRAGSGNSELAK